jgi:hypothetical protein
MMESSSHTAAAGLAGYRRRGPAAARLANALSRRPTTSFRRPPSIALANPALPPRGVERARAPAAERQGRLVREVVRQVRFRACHRGRLARLRVPCSMPSSLSCRRSTQPREDDVSLRVSHRGPVGDAADRARAAAADAIVSAPPSVATSRSPARAPAPMSADPAMMRLLSPGCGLPGVPRSARNAAPRVPKRVGTKPTLSTPMSPPAARPESTTILARPPASIATSPPPISSGAITWPAKRPKERGATAMPPSTRGACCATVRTLPRQSIA